MYKRVYMPPPPPPQKKEEEANGLSTLSNHGNFSDQVKMHQFENLWLFIDSSEHHYTQTSEFNNVLIELPQC